MDILLINIADVRKLTDLSKNVLSSKYKQYIISAQNIQLKEIIGKDCLNELLTAKCAKTTTPLQDELLDLVKPFLINYSYAKYVYSSPLTSTEEGIVKLSGDNIIHLTDQEKKREQQFYISNAEGYKDQIIELLKDNKEGFPCYHTTGKCSCCSNNKDGALSIFN